MPIPSFNFTCIFARGRDPQYLISRAQFCYAACRLLGLSVGGQHSSAGSALAWLSYRRDRIRTDPRRHWHKIGDRHHRGFRSSPFLSSYNRRRSNRFALMQQKRRQSAATRQLTTASFVSPHAQLSCNMRRVSVLPSNLKITYKFARGVSSSPRRRVFAPPPRWHKRQ